MLCGRHCARHVVVPGLQLRISGARSYARTSGRANMGFDVTCNLQACICSVLRIEHGRAATCFCQLIPLRTALQRSIQSMHGAPCSSHPSWYLLYPSFLLPDKYKMPSAGQLVATTQRSKPQPAGDDSIDFHNTENNQPVSLKQPTAKEMAAAKAARIRLGYEQADDAAGADELVSICHVTCLRPEYVDFGMPRAVSCL